MAFKDYMIGPFLCTIRVIILLLNALWQTRMCIYGGSTGRVPSLGFVNAVVTAMWAGLALYGIVLAFRGNHLGGLFMVIAGIGGIVGSLTIIHTYVNDYGATLSITLNNTTNFIDLVLILVGGIISYGLKKRDEI